MKKERVKHITRLHIILFFLAVIVIVSIVIVIKNKTSGSDQKYKDFEVELVNASKTYMKIKDLTLDDGKSLKIELENLIESNTIQNELANECNGYVLVSRQKSSNTSYENVFESFISCGNDYMTPGYVEEY